ncbi:hypothetical protein C0J52_07240 [Blattella germanica]|nr:hypothetical protein C0J52_07240 [Blattella germanica]
MFARPKPDDTEEDLLRQQEDFFRNKKSPAASLINKRKSQDDKEPESVSGYQEGVRKKPCSKFAARKAEKNSSHDEQTEKIVGPAVLGEILEKNLQNVAALPPRGVSKQGFPEVFVRDKSLVASGKSIFAQQAARLKMKEMEVMEVDGNASKSNKEIDNSFTKDKFGDRSYILTGAEAQKIHEENTEKLSEMSAEDILKEKQRLMEQIDPNLLNFIRSRRQMKDIVQISNKSNQPGTSESSKMETNAGNEMETNQSVINDNNDSTSGISNQSEANTLTGLDSVMDEHTEIELPIKLEEANKWLHMDVVEKDKLKWIGELPPPPPVPTNSPYSARFDFQGLLLPYSDENLDVTKALHHHGEEPERPGYTLQELLQLSRSSVLQQRTKAGYYDECLEAPLLNQLADADLYLLLRFSLDDSTEIMLTATLQALRNLLWNEADELCADRLLGLWNGHLQPCLFAKNEVKKESEKEELKEDEAEMKDHQILKLDMIKGALRTDLMLRLRYILEVLKPGPKAVINVLEILTRIVRHSHDSALAVSCCPRLLNLIISSFIPKDWKGIVGINKPSEMSSVYGVPLVEALKLLRVLACSSRSLASDLVHKFGIMDSVVSYISIDPRECGLPQQEAVRLSLESFYLWNTLLAYNFATTQFIDMYPILMRLLQFHLSATSAADATSTFGHEHGAALMSLLTQAMLAADAQMKRLASQKVANIPQKIPVTVTFEHISGFAQPVNLCLKKWLNQLIRAEEITFTALKLVAASLNCAAVRINKFSSQPGVDSVSLLEELEDLMHSTVEPLLCSTNFKLICSRVKSSSCLLGTSRSGRDRDPPALPSIGSLMWGGRDVMPSISAKSPLAFLQGLAHFLSSICSLHRGLHSQSLQHFLDNPRLLDYMTHLGRKNLHAGDNWFTHVETTMLAHMLKLLAIVLPNTDFQHVGVFHNMAVRLVTVLSADEKFLAREIFSQVIYNPDFFRDCSDVAYQLETLNLSDVAQEQDKASIHSLLDAATNKIPNLWNYYEYALNLGGVRDHNPLDINTQTASESGLEPAFPSDWFYLPILRLYTDAFSGYTQLVEQFAAVSYGDELFGHFILIPLQQRHSPSFRKLVWSEHAAVLRVLRTKPQQLAVPMREYLEPCETDMSLLMCYFRGVMTGQIREVWCPVLYQVALHHVASFISQNSETEIAQQLKSRIQQLGNKVPNQWRIETDS